MKTQNQQFLPSALKSVGKVKEQQCKFHLACEYISDEEVAEQAKTSKECFACIVERYDYKLKMYVKRITGAPQETVEDIVQEVFLKVYANIDKFDRNLKFSSWIYRIAHNQAVNKYVYEKRRKTESVTTDEGGEAYAIMKDRHDTWQKIQQDNINKILHAALSEVSEKYQEVIILNYFQEKSYQEISSELKKPVNTVGTMLSRGKKLLEKELRKMNISRDVALV